MHEGHEHGGMSREMVRKHYRRLALPAGHPQLVLVAL